MTPDVLPMFDTEVSFEDARVVLVPIPFDATVSYGVGASLGPQAIQAASCQVELYDQAFGRPDQAGIVMLPPRGNIPELNARARIEAAKVQNALAEGEAPSQDAIQGVNALCQALNQALHGQVSALLAAQRIVGTIGGDHGSVYGAIQAHSEAFPAMGILHIDAHADLRGAYQGFEFSHASIMDNVMRTLPGVSALVQVGIRDLCEGEIARIDEDPRITTFYDRDLADRRMEGTPWSAQVGDILSALPEDVYISLDIDGLDPSLCPGTGTPVPGGLSFHQLTYLLQALGRSGRRIVGFDLVEVAPGPSGDEWDANVGARVLYQLIGWTLRSQGLLGGGDLSS